MPVEVFEEHYKRICYYFKLSDDGSSRLSKEVCDKYPEFVVRVFEKTLYSGGDLSLLPAYLPEKILEQHREAIAKAEHLMSERKVVQAKLSEARILDDQLKDEIRNVRESIINRYKGDSDDGAR
jgi:hypothetical protein